MYQIDKAGNRIRTLNGMADLVFRGWSVKSADIYLSPHASIEGFSVTYNHELIHVYHAYKFGRSYNDNDYSESTAHAYEESYFPYETYQTSYTPGRSIFDIPDYLIRVPMNPIIKSIPTF